MGYFGCHLSASGGNAVMVKTALSIGANTFAFFTRNPRGSKAKPEDPADTAKAAAMLGENHFGKLVAYVGKSLKVGIRPEDMKDDEEFLEKHPSSHIDTEVEVSELMGAEIYLYLTYKGQNLMARVAPTSKSRRGDKVTMAMDTHKIHLFDPETELTLLN